MRARRADRRHHHRAREGRPLGHHPRRREGVPARARRSTSARSATSTSSSARTSSSRSSSSTRSAATSCSRAACSSRRSATSSRSQTLEKPQGGPDRQGHRQEHHRVRRVHRPRRHRRPAPHHRHELGPGQSPVRAVQGRRRGHGQGPQVQRRDRARLARPQADHGRPVEPRRREVPAGHASSRARSSRSRTTARSSSSSRASKASSTSARCRWTKPVKHPSKMVAVGDKVEAVVLDIDVKQNRISLGMKQLEPNPWSSSTEKYPPGTVVKGKVRNITDYGVFVEIEEGIDGLVHISDMSWTQRVKHPASSTRRATKSRRSSSTSTPRREKPKISLGIKQLVPRSVGPHPVRLPGRQGRRRQGPQGPRLRRVRRAREGRRGSRPRLARSATSTSRIRARCSSPART